MRKTFLLMLAALSGAGRAAAPISKTEIRAASGAEAKRLAMAQISDLLIPYGTQGRKGYRPKHPLGDLWFYTRPHGTATRGVCVSNIVIVRFRAVAEGPRNADTPVAASDIESSIRYKLLVPVQPKDMDQLDADDQVRADRACAAIHVPDTDMIQAPDEETAITALWQLRMARSAVEKHQDLSLNCDGFKQSCDTVLTGLNPAKVDSIQACPAAQNARCYTIEADDVSIEIRSDSDDRITSVKLEQQIIFADYRGD